jgi:transposase-like protein
MSTPRKARHNYTPAEKVAILRRHLLEKVPVADLCEEYQLQPSIFYQWQKQFFEHGAAAFGKEKPQAARAAERRIAELEAKLTRKNLGSSDRRLGSPGDTRRRH